jgi:ketosteroid isomerase-like protein
MNDGLRERLGTLYAAFQAGKFDFVLNAIDDDIEFISYSPVQVFPFLGHRRGKAEMAEVLRGARAMFDFVTCEPLSIVVENDNAAVQLFSRLVSRKTGRSAQGHGAHFFRFRQDKIVELRTFSDTFRSVEQMLGRKLIAGAIT